MPQVLIRLSALLMLLLLRGDAVVADDRAGREQSLDRLLDELSAVQSYGDVAISPDGKAVAWVQAERSKPGVLTADKKIHVLQLGVDPLVPRRIRAENGVRSEQAPAWSPD